MSVIKTYVECRICLNSGVLEDYINIYDVFNKTTSILQIIINISSIKVVSISL